MKSWYVIPKAVSASIGLLGFIIAIFLVLNLNVSAGRRVQMIVDDRLTAESALSDREALARTRELVSLALLPAESARRVFQERLAPLQLSETVQPELLKSTAALVEEARQRIGIANGSALSLRLSNEVAQRSVTNLSRTLERLGTSIAVLDRFVRDYAEHGSTLAIGNLRGIDPWVSPASMDTTLRQLRASVDDFNSGRRPCAVAISVGCDEASTQVHLPSSAPSSWFIAQLWISPLAVLYCAWFVSRSRRWWRVNSGSGTPAGPAPGLAA
jgi:hypothetical protein